MLSSRDSNGIRSARKYAVPHASSPLARDSTMMPMHVHRKDSFSTSNHSHGLGGEAKEAMLRSGLRVKRTSSSLRIVATKGNAILTAAFHHIVHVPADLEVYRRCYSRKEDEFAESIPSATSPFQFVPKNTQDILVSKWQRDKSDKIQLPAESDSQQMEEWLKEMRLKVHIRLVQKQQFTNTANPIEHQSEKVDKESGLTKKTLSRLPSCGGTEVKKGDKPAKGELTLDALEPPPTKHSPTKKRERKERISLPPLQHKPQIELVAPPADKPHLPKISSHDSNMLSTSSSLNSTDSIARAPGTPLFYPRQPAGILARRTYSEQDVRRLRIKARNSVGLDPIT